MGEMGVISPVVSPRAYSDSTTSSTSVRRRWPFLTIWGSKGVRPVPRHVDVHGAAGVGQDRLRSDSIAGVARSMPHRIVSVVAEVLAELLIQGSFDHRFGDRLEQPVRAGQRHPGITGLAHQFAGDFQLVDLATSGTSIAAAAASVSAFSNDVTAI